MYPVARNIVNNLNMSLMIALLILFGRNKMLAVIYVEILLQIEIICKIATTFPVDTNQSEL
jgi:hypothetical protein